MHAEFFPVGACDWSKMIREWPRFLEASKRYELIKVEACSRRTGWVDRLCLARTDNKTRSTRRADGQKAAHLFRPTDPSSSFSCILSDNCPP